MKILKINETPELFKIIIIIVLISFTFILTYIFQILLNITVIYSHFYYLPIILGCIWWRFKGLTIPLFLAALLLIFTFLQDFTLLTMEFWNNVFRAIIILIIGLVVAVLSESLNRSEAALKNESRRISCLYGIIKAIKNPNNSVEEILTETLNKVKWGYQYPQMACARIVFDERVFKTLNYESTPWRISAKTRVKERNLSLDVHYLEEISFLEEEKNLLEEILTQLKAIFELKLTWIY